MSVLPCGQGKAIHSPSHMAVRLEERELETSSPKAKSSTTAFSFINIPVQDGPKPSSRVYICSAQ